MSSTTITTPSRFAQASTPAESSQEWTPRGLSRFAANSTPEGDGTPKTQRRERESSPTPVRGTQSPGFGGMLTGRTVVDSSSALSKLQPAQVRELREGFQILDRDSDGLVGREDVADMLTQLGLPSTQADLTSFFPPSSPQTLTLPAFLSSIATLLASLSPSAEMLSAFSAFDEDDSGQIDVKELRDALLHTAPDPGEKALTEREVDRVMSGFMGRRAFGKMGGGMGMGKRGEVFRYQEFVSGLAGGSAEEKERDE
ncbi:EF-hand [Glarea lozoyensis ATCC 20868]|uniref:EF-hand n=1 Tax=Glarea lozoyensis (strain ATCC 20868 / MF5171) TaxID=1116229 RepID=S3DCL3_GLAL2|nr:EF-hand [Glarea lozoyensis ATCC 20868]EPE36157.1 EF-hand [Glarea lozoyensis ATCC 20868]